MSEVVTKVICFYGVVQGVGFRPTVAVLAAENNMVGEVSNVGGFVRLIVTDTPERIDALVSFICARKPRSSEIVHVESREIELVRFDDFTITASSVDDDVAAAVPADIAICDNCLAEFRDPSNPRHRHPFISCTDCGPRFTIMNRLPYDRDTTAMDEFPMCEMCDGEYFDEGGRRYHAQTISCHECGPQALWVSLAGGRFEPRNFSSYSSEKFSVPNLLGDAERQGQGRAPSVIASETRQSGADIEIAIRCLREDGVIALKGLGGYYLVCSPFSVDAVRMLRQIKEREAKPFAVMFPSVDEVRKYCDVNSEESALMESSKRPIVLCNKLGHNGHNVDGSSCLAAVDNFVSGVCDESMYVGAFLPSFGLQHLLLDELGPLIMTSCNPSELPIVKDDDAMFAFAEEHADELGGILYHKRKIVTAMDDSVARVIDGKPQIIRRAKGYAPLPIYMPKDTPHRPLRGITSTIAQNSPSVREELIDSRIGGQSCKETHHFVQYSTPVRESWRQTRTSGESCNVFAAGADLKSSFALSKGSFIYPSRFIGDLGSVEQMDEYKAELVRMKEFFSVEPDVVVCDMHPGYESVRFAETLHGDTPLRGMSPEKTGADKTGDKNDKTGTVPSVLHVQHHHAHVASVMAEHRLTSVIGVSFDGTGYGPDGCIWGGEILLVNRDGVERYSHLDYVEMLGGDSSMKDGWKSALSHMLQGEIAGQARNDACEKRRDSRLCGNDMLRKDCKQITGDRLREDCRQITGVIPAQAGISDICERTFSVDISKLILYSEAHGTLAEYGDVSDVSTPLGQAASAIRASVNTVRSSSMGRLFDAAASLLGLAHVNRYEGECAICLEAAARRAMHHPGVDEADDLALEFHKSVVGNILVEVLDAREETGRNDVCISGGVFQNKILTERVLALLRTNDFDVYYNESVPPNDGGIALGQVYVAKMRSNL